MYHVCGYASSCGSIFNVACTFRMLNFSMVVSGSTAVVYLLDTHGPNALHILALSNFSKNMVLYGSTFFANGMVQSRGVTVSLFILAACQGFCWLATIPMFIFGKRVRSHVSFLPSSLLRSQLTVLVTEDRSASAVLCCEPGINIVPFLHV